MSQIQGGTTLLVGRGIATPRTKNGDSNNPADGNCNEGVAVRDPWRSKVMLATPMPTPRR